MALPSPYEQDEQHNTELDLIRSQNLPITNAVFALSNLYCRLYNISTHTINHGLCEDFAHDLASLFPGAIAAWGDAFLPEDAPEEDFEFYTWHCVVLYQGKYYDSEHPWGETDFRRMKTFNR